MSFNLRDHIREILADTREENLDVLVRKVFESTPKASIREAYRQALTETVREQLAKAPRPDQEPCDNQMAGIGAGSTSTRGGQDHLDTQTASTSSGGGNVRNSRAALLRRHRFRVTVGIGDKTYRHILECTVGNLEYAAAENEHQAEANLTAARKYRRLAKKMIERSVQTVADLIDEDIEEALRDE